MTIKKFFEVRKELKNVKASINAYNKAIEGTGIKPMKIVKNKRR